MNILLPLFQTIKNIWDIMKLNQSLENIFFKNRDTDL